MTQEHRADLSQELAELFEMKKAKIKDEKRRNLEANEIQKDIQLLTLMFIDGISNIEVRISATESILWDEKSQKLLYKIDNNIQMIEGTSREVRLKIRPYLVDLVKKAKEFYKD